MGLHRDRPALGSVRMVARDPVVSFNRDIKPILAERCFKCHGPDPAAREADLRLDTHAGATAELESGLFAIVPGRPDESALIARITHADEDERMPPADAGDRLSEQEIALLRQWIADGAKWETHWSYVPVAEPVVPRVADGAVHPVDAYVRTRLAQEGLTPSPRADRYTLIRRVSLDLTGLPPTPEEVDAFVNDAREDAYERLVDRLLASPRFGERWATVWLDLARYADTMGYEKDLRRTIWPYRDWVIEAFNADEGFDQFTIDQLAGDLLPGASRAQRVATAFHRNTMTNDEGGTDDEEYRVAAVVDRTNTTMQAWMGVTVGCAQCHAHKYDPISHEEYYSLFAFFNQTQDADRTDESPTMDVPTPEQAESLAAIEAELAAFDARVDALADEVAYEEPPVVDPSSARVATEPVDYYWIDDRVPRGAVEEATGDGNVWHWVDLDAQPAVSGTRASKRTVAEFGQHFFTKASKPLVLHEGDVLVAHVLIDTDAPPREIMLQWFSERKQWDHRAYWGENLINFGADGTHQRLHMGDLPAGGAWVRLEIPIQAVGLEPGDAISGWAFSQHSGTVSWDASGINTREPPDDRELVSMLAWEALARAHPDQLPEPIAQALMIEASERSVEQSQSLRRYYIKNVFSATQDQFTSLDALRREITMRLTAVQQQIPNIPILVENEPDDLRTTHLFERGSFLSPAQVVQPNVPRAFGNLDPSLPRNRLGLARWMVSKDNPLTARVMANRVWEQLFGLGIVETSEDFGTQGSRPTHPALLDDLAWRFMDSGWRFKSLCRLIVTSETYKQSSEVTDAGFERDPRNRLLARGPRFRLHAEMVRDQALATSGLLSDKMFGPPVFPPQPEGVWQVVYSGDRWKTSVGEDRHRRALYTFLRRTSPYPSMTTFDAPSREVCTLRRIPTNTPLQALVTLNDPVYVEAAQGLARLVTLRRDDPSSIARVAMKRVFCRPAAPDEVNEIVALYQNELHHFRSNPDDAVKLASDPIGPIPQGTEAAQLAAWTVVCNVLLNLDETLTRN
jgi:Protein of unknown function (DUF1553)/Protein of unknown function (DUF1549)/Planctomycete cytochrome C